MRCRDHKAHRESKAPRVYPDKTVRLVRKVPRGKLALRVPLVRTVPRETPVPRDRKVILARRAPREKLVPKDRKDHKDLPVRMEDIISLRWTQRETSHSRPARAACRMWRGRTSVARKVRKVPLVLTALPALKALPVKTAATIPPP